MAGILLGAEELVLVAVALVTVLLSGMVQSAFRARRARGNWRMGVAFATSDAEVGSELDMTVTLAAAGRGGATPVWLEDPQECWDRVHRGEPVGASATGARPIRLCCCDWRSSRVVP